MPPTLQKGSIINGYRIEQPFDPGAMAHSAKAISPSKEVVFFKQYKLPLALILGNEARGVSPEVLAMCDAAVDLPMLGDKASINVGNAAAAALYGIYAKIKQSLVI